ncbi:MAG: site-2 protease family protein [Defluviitaleaceae bacterium]|nr:site-2 protease family protein [Defluviitaleaceae bacterium]
MSTVIPILIFLLILGVVVFVHELGHFLAARGAGVFVEEFALGFGPKLFYFRGRKKEANGEATVYSIRMIPAGGFCKLYGQESDEEITNPDRCYNGKSVPARMLVMAGGSIMNFLLAFILFFVLTLLTGYQITEVRGLPEVSPARQAGLQVGDRVTHINGARVSLWENFLLQMEFSGGAPMDVRVNRNGTIHHFVVTPQETSPGVYRLGFWSDFRYGLLDEPIEGFRRVGLWGSTRTAGEMMLFNIRLPFTMLARWVTDQHMPAGANVMGPIGMAGEVTVIYQQVIERGVGDMVLTMLFFAGLLSAALGLFNLLPIPAMDGARLVFLIIEGIRRKPVPPEREGMIHLAGFVLIISLGIFLAYRDIIRLIPS